LEKMPVLAWVIIGIAALMIIGLNISLVAAWRRRNEKTARNRGKESLWTKAWDIEDRQINELSARVEKLKDIDGLLPKNPPDNQNHTGG